MVERFQDYIRNNKLYSGNGTVLLGVSGGVDSMVMLHLFQATRIPVKVAHCHFGLRGEEADKDQHFVEQYCAENKLIFVHKKLNTKEFSSSHKVSIQMAARTLRRTWFRELLTSAGCEAVATAHHLNDAIESVVVNLIKGADWEGVRGMQPRVRNHIHPMLFATREEIISYAKAQGISWREDASNQTVQYERNFIRHQVFPMLKKLNPSLEHTFRGYLQKATHWGAAVTRGIADWKATYVHQSGPYIYIDKAGVEQDNTLLWPFLKPFGFNMSQAIQIIEGVQKQPGACFEAPAYTLYIDRAHLIISPSGHRRFEVSITAPSTVSSGTETLHVAINSDWQRGGHEQATFDADKVGFPLVWRTWQAGDYLHLLGSGHKKKVSDLLIDLKIPVPVKEAVSVLTMGDEILWVVGYRQNDRSKVSSATTRFLAIAHDRKEESAP